MPNHKVDKSRMYGTLRQYKRLLRGRKNYKNPSEEVFKNKCQELGVDFIRRGYPDFIIIKNNEIFG